MSAPGDMQMTDHVADLLPAFANGTLPSPERGRVMDHIQGCAACAADLRAWQAIRQATRAAALPAPAAPDAILDYVWDALDRREIGQHVPHQPTMTLRQPRLPGTKDDAMTAYAFPLAPLGRPDLFVPDRPPPHRGGPATTRVWLSLLAVAALLLLVIGGAVIQRGNGSDLSSLTGLLLRQQGMPPDVPMYRGNPIHSGESPGPGPVSKPEVLWQAKTGGQMRTSPALVNGVLYLASLDGHIYAFDHATGEERWRFDTGGSPEAHPTVADGLVFAGDNEPYQADGTLFVLNAADGSERWQLPDAQTNAPLVVDGVLFTGTSDGVFHAFNASDGEERWRVETAPLSRGATMADGLLYFGGKDGVIYALNAANGVERWRYQTEGGQLGTVAVVDGMVYEIAFDGPADQLYALDAVTGEERWRFAINARLQPPAIRDGVVYLPGGDGSVYALDAAKGTVRWRFDFVDPTVYGPILAGDTLYVTGGHPALFAVDAATGKEEWHVDLDGPIGTSPIVSGGVIYVTTDTGSLYALGERTADLPALLPAPNDVGSADRPVEIVWQAQNGTAPIDQPHGMALAPDGAIWLAEGGADRILIFSPDGALLEAWGTPGPSEGEFNFLLESGGGSYGGVSFDQDGNIFVADSGNYRIQKFDRNRQFVTAWGTQGSGDGQFLGPVHVVTDAEGNVYVSDEGGIQKFASDGTFLGRIGRWGNGEDEYLCTALFNVDAHGNVYIPECERHRVMKFAPDGSLLMTFGSEGRGAGQLNFPVATAVDTAGNIYVADSRNARVQVFDATGTYLAGWGEFGTEEGQFGETNALVLDGAGNVYTADYGNGTLQKFSLRSPLVDDAGTPTASSVDASIVVS